MVIFERDGWIIEYDYEKTLSYYNRADDGEWAQNYSECCLPCKNFSLLINNYSSELIRFLNNFGIIQEVTAHLSSVYTEEPGKQLYFMSYSIVGKVIKKPEDFESYNSGHRTIHPVNIDNNFRYHFTENIFTPENIITDSEPVIRLEIDGFFPWVLQEEQK